MASKKTKKAQPKRKAKGKAKSGKRKREPPAREAKIIVRRNAAPRRTRTPSKSTEEDRERKALTKRVDEMSGAHVATGVGVGALGNALGVIAVGKGWISPKWTAGLLMGTGAATMAAGWYWEQDHMMAAGAGMTTAGAFSITNQLAVDAYEAMEAKADEKRQKKEAEEAEKERLKRLADARALLEQEAEEGKSKQRNARRIVILDRDGEPIDADFEEWDAA